MRAFKAGSFHKDYLKLWQVHKKSASHFSQFDQNFARIIQGRFLLLNNRFEQEHIMLTRHGRPVLMATHFRPREKIPLPASLGSFVAHPDLQNEDIEFFWQEVRKRYDHSLVGPMNGHHYLGFSFPIQPTKPIGFMTSPFHPQEERIFSLQRDRRIHRHYYSYITTLTPELLQKCGEEILGKPKNLHVIPLNRWNPRQDISLMNQLVNHAFTEHFEFVPLTDEENWDILKMSLLILKPHHLLFLYEGDRPIGFCLALNDHNEVLRPGDSDPRNALSLLFSYPRRARLVHIGLLPEFQGQGLIKYLRNSMILSLAAHGIQELESSYIDEGNRRSQGNVQSKGASLANTFQLFRFQ